MNLFIQNRTIWRLISILFCIFFIASCSSKSKYNEIFPEKLVMGFNIGSDALGTIAYRRLLANYLQKELKLKKIDFFYTTDHAPIIEAMKTNKIDIAYFGELSYVLAHEKAGAEPMVMYALPNSNIPVNSVIFTYSGSGLNSIEDVKKNSKKLTLMFADPASTSGHLYPRDYLTRIGLEPEKFFKQVSFANGHAMAIFSVKSHKVDMACTTLLGLKRLVAKGQLSEKDFKILWTSDAYPSAPICIRTGLPQKFKEMVKQALLNLPKKDPQTWKEYKDKALIYYSKEIRDKIIFVESTDSIYNPIRRVARNIKNFDMGIE